MIDRKCLAQPSLARPVHAPSRVGVFLLRFQVIHVRVSGRASMLPSERATSRPSDRSGKAGHARDVPAEWALRIAAQVPRISHDMRTLTPRRDLPL